MANAIKAMAGPAGGPDRDTTHLSVIDAEGNAVALTTSIGPHFGAAVASAETGTLFAHSYRMVSSPEPGARDWTEMTPSVAFGPDGGTLAIGGAGSERIPVAIAHALFHLFGRGQSLGHALVLPRLSWKEGRLRLHCDHGDALGQSLRNRGFPVEYTARSHRNHLGVVQAVLRHPDGTVEAAADPAYDGRGCVCTARHPTSVQ